MLPLKEPIDPFLDDIGTRAETMLRWKRALVHRQLMQPPKPYNEEATIYQASFYPKPGAPPDPRRRRAMRQKP